MLLTLTLTLAVTLLTLNLTPTLTLITPGRQRAQTACEATVGVLGAAVGIGRAVRVSQGVGAGGRGGPGKVRG